MLILLMPLLREDKAQCLSCHSLPLPHISIININIILNLTSVALFLSENRNRVARARAASARTSAEWARLATLVCLIPFHSVPSANRGARRWRAKTHASRDALHSGVRRMCEQCSGIAREIEMHAKRPDKSRNDGDGEQNISLIMRVSVCETTIASLISIMYLMSPFVGTCGVYESGAFGALCVACR